MKKILFLSPAIFLFMISACSINQFAVRIVADALTGSEGGSVFMTDDDPEFIAAALPFALKTFESLLQSDPKNIDLIEATAGGFISYANGFLQSPAELMEYDQIEVKERLLTRAAAMYRRGGGYASRGLELVYPEFNLSFSNGDSNLALMNLENNAVPFLYWKAAAIMGEFSVDSFNPELMVKIPQAVAFAVRALELEEDYNKGAIHDLLISIFANLPVNLIYSADETVSTYSVKQVLEDYYSSYGYGFKEMSLEDQAIFHFDLSIQISRGLNASPYVSISPIYIINQDTDSFISVLNKAIEIDLDLNPENRLQNIISQRKARWFLEHIEDYFFIL
ncbi:MAG: TRAP transporter TatT component family protein [Spirochaetia bacterium]|jgi:tetratricopeptide (TPR) repeat protein|nr:TRAP transporter TatT component family protein [Spirochaetia bacterium]